MRGPVRWNSTAAFIEDGSLVVMFLRVQGRRKDRVSALCGERYTNYFLNGLCDSSSSRGRLRLVGPRTSRNKPSNQHAPNTITSQTITELIMAWLSLPGSICPAPCRFQGAYQTDSPTERRRGSQRQC